MRFLRRALLVAIALMLVQSARANGGPIAEGVPASGNGAPSRGKELTPVTIEEEQLAIDLHQEFAAVEVRYRMRNLGPSEIAQDFFFPVERWQDDLRGYQIELDGTTVASDDLAPPKPPGREGFDEPPIRHWKKSVLAFEAGQAREVRIRYQSRYAVGGFEVSEHSHREAETFRYLLSPAAGWKGPINRGLIVVNIMKPEIEWVVVTKPAGRFQRTSPTRFEWGFANLKPGLADDLEITLHPAYEGAPDPQLLRFTDGYELHAGGPWFLIHRRFSARASSTREARGEESFAPVNLEERGTDSGTPPPWIPGKGDGVGESVTLAVRQPRPLDGVLFEPGYDVEKDQARWWRYNRVAEVELVLNEKQKIRVTIPNERFRKAYPIVVRGFREPVRTVKFTILAVHRGTDVNETPISGIWLRAKLTKKPRIGPSR